MAFKGAITFFVVSVAAFSLTSAAVTPTKVAAKETKAEDGRLFFTPTTGTTSDTSITISNDTLALIVLVFLALAAALIIPAIIGGSLFAGSESASGYGASAYHGSAPAYAHDESSYASIHRSLDDAADKYN